MQQQIDANSHDLAQMRNQNARFQATTHNEVEQLRSEIQTLSGTLEENNVVHGQEIKDIKKRLGSLTATLVVLHGVMDSHGVLLSIGV
jgi:hypothetical protein